MGEELRDFFPATRDTFVERAGHISCITKEDLKDEFKKRHLESYKSSMREWKLYEADADTISAVTMEFAKEINARSLEIADAHSLEKIMRQARKKYHTQPSKTHLYMALKQVWEQPCVCSETKTCSHHSVEILEQLLLRRAVRTSSGVAVITVLTSPGSFSCRHDCHYCPNEPGQPRSYLSTEPAVLRANQCEWDAAVQFWDRARTLHRNGHVVDKIEALVLGGTWSGYSCQYQEEFCRDLFYAANEFPNFIKMDESDEFTSILAIRDRLRPRQSLEEEQLINESNDVKIIGLTLETRPDYINEAEIKCLRYYGCTRVQLGVQHTNDAILRYVNRGHTIDHVRKALKLLKDSCYKVDVHLMPDLPSSTVEEDEIMFDKMLRDPTLQADQWKIYPCEVTPFTTISKWYDEGSFVPYSEEEGGAERLFELILKVKYAMHPWIRLNRVIRDIPNQSIIAGNSFTNLRQMLGMAAEAHGWQCPCMRCREIRQEAVGDRQMGLVIRAFDASGATEYFISYESHDRIKLGGFLRLRIPNFAEKDRTAFEMLNGRCGLIRELHVYGILVSTTEKKSIKDSRFQHSGIGRMLMCTAEALAIMKGCDSIVIIAGIGTRNYYRKFGYELHDSYMCQTLEPGSVLRKYRETVGDYLSIEHVCLEQLKSINSVEINISHVKDILNKTYHKQRRKSDTKVSSRATEYNWKERITLPSDHLTMEATGLAPKNESQESKTTDILNIPPRTSVDESNINLAEKQTQETLDTLRKRQTREQPVVEEPDHFAEARELGPVEKAWCLVKGVWGSTLDWMESNPGMTAGLAVGGVAGLSILRALNR